MGSSGHLGILFSKLLSVVLLTIHCIIYGVSVVGSKTINLFQGFPQTAKEISLCGYIPKKKNLSLF
jgi:hypothetical protein